MSTYYFLYLYCYLYIFCICYMLSPRGFWARVKPVLLKFSIFLTKLGEIIFYLIWFDFIMVIGATPGQEVKESMHAIK